MTVEIICGDISALPSSDHATELLPLTDGDTLTLSCTDSDLKAAYRVLRAIMDYGYEHAQPSRVRLICADEASRRAYSFQWNMWFAAESQNTKIKKKRRANFRSSFSHK